MIKSWGHEWHFTHLQPPLTLKQFPEVPDAKFFGLIFPDISLNYFLQQIWGLLFCTHIQTCTILICVTIHDCRIRSNSLLNISVPQILRGTNSGSYWPNLTALLHGNPWPSRLHNSPSQEVSLYFFFFFSLVFLSVNTSTLTGVAIFISLIEE